MLTASHSRETACERSLRSAPILTQPRKPDPTPHAGNDTPAAFVGTGGRLRSECMVAFNRNPWPQSPESAESPGAPSGSAATHPAVRHSNESTESVGALRG